MAGLTITSSSTTGFYLSDTASNPVSIAAGVTINGAASYAIGSAIPIDWTIINSGTLLAPGTSALSYGIVLQTGSAPATTSIGSITNTQTGLIEGYFDAVAVRGAGTVANFGTIIARADKGGAIGFDSATSSYSALSAGVVLESGGISNARSALVQGYYIGVAIDSGGSVVNAGTIEGYGSEGYGVVLSGGGSVTNVTGGTIYGGQDGIEAFTVPISVYNQGLIAGGNRAAIALGVGGAVTNASGATLSGYAAGVEFFSPGASSVTNEARGVITGGSYGVEVESTSPLTLDNAGILTGTASSGAFLHGGGLVTNALGGTIQGGRYGLFSEDSTTLTNAGVVSGTAGVGIAVAAAASISNATSGQIIGGNDGVYAGGTGYSSLTNDGLIVGSITSGAVLASGGSVINAFAATIVGGAYGINVPGGAGTYSNAGSIFAGAQGARSFGVLMQHGGYVSNAQTGTISGQYYGVVVQSSQGTVVNVGTIVSLQAYNHQMPFDAAAVQLAEGGSVTNSAGGFIRAQWIGVQIGTDGSVPVAGTVVNQGTIIATDGTNGAGIWITGPGMISNAASGTIAGGPYAIVAYNQITLVNAGSIGGSLFGLDPIGSGFADRVVADPGATFAGTFSGGNTLGSAVYSTLELASGSSSGTIANVGTFVDFGQIALDAGASWSLGGGVVAGETVAFGGSYAALTLLDPTAAQGTMSGFVASDTIVLAGVTATTGVSFSGNTLIVSQSHGPNLSLLFDAPRDLTYAVVDGSTDITTACFAQGTRIRTASGPVAVEALRPGMQVRSAFGGCREIIWIGHRHVDCARHPRPKTVWPIEIEPGAFGTGLPTATLRVSPDHAIYLNQVLIPARYLVNGSTIRQVAVDEVTYYHVELPRHDVLFAEGLPVESYLDIGDRSNFSGSMPVGLFPDFSTPAPNLAAVWEAAGCAPLVVHGPELEAARTLLSSSGLSAAWSINSKSGESSR